MMEPIFSLGEWIRRRRKTLDLTQPALATCVGCALITIQKIEADERRPSAVMAERLADCLAIPAGERAAFLQSARAERAPDRLPNPQIDQPLPDATPARHNLPAPATLVLGRAEEISTLAALLHQPHSRLLTLVGPGGVGKTTLALALAHSILDFGFSILDSTELANNPKSKIQNLSWQDPKFPDGVWFIEVAALTDPTLVAQSVAAPFGLPQQSTQAYGAALVTYLRDKRLLLLLDNCEHLLAACATLAQQLLHASPGLTILATSREPLNIAGEQEWRVLPLPTPELPLGRKSSPTAAEISGLPAVQCFVRRAQMVQNSFQLSDQNALAVTRICQQVDGLPLALELAAARVKSLSVEEISRRLTSELGAGLTLLTSGRRTAPPHQQTLRATLDWSYALLNDEERRLLQTLAVFAGGFTLAAAEGISEAPADLLDGLTSLVDKSLVVARPQVNEAANGEMRYLLLETIRQYGAEKLAASGQMPQVQHRHLIWFAHWAAAAAHRLIGHEQALWFTRLEREQDNCRAALSFALDHERTVGLDLLMALWYFWSVYGLWGEQDEWLRRFQVTAETAPPTPTGVKALALAAHKHKKAERERTFAAALTLAERIGDQSGLAYAYFQQAHSSWWRDTESARRAFAQSEAIARACDDQWQLAQILRARGEFDYTRLEARADARTHMADSLALFRQLGDRYGVADALVHLADVAFEQGDLAAAQHYGREGLTLSRTLGFKYGVLWGLMVLGSAAGGQGDFAQSRLLLEECVTVARELGAATFTALALYWLATTLRLQGDLSQARSLYEECGVVAKKDNDQTMLAGADYGLGEVARRRGDYAIAATHFQQALIIWRAINYQWGLARVLGALGLLALEQAQPVAAARLLSAASARRRTALLGLPPLEQHELATMQATLQTRLGDSAFVAAWADGQTMTLDQVIETSA